MTGDPQRLRQMVKARMAEFGMHDWTQLGTSSGVKPRTLTNILAGHPSRRRTAVEIALRWAPGSIEQVLSGGEASPLIREVVAAGRDDGAVMMREDDATLRDAARELRKATEQMVRVVERVAQAAAVIADEVEGQ